MSIQESSFELARSEIVIPAMEGGESLGLRLRAAREALDWSASEVAKELRLPLRVIERLERDDYDGISDAVFLRGYLASYARLVDVPIAAVEKVVGTRAQVAPLVATGAIPRSRYLVERYAASATYLVLTALIIVPAVWLATHGGLQQNLAHVTPLDPPSSQDTAQVLPAGAIAAAGADAHEAGSTPQATTPAPAAPESAPIIASMTPFQVAEPARSAAPAPAPVADVAVAGTGSHVVRLTLGEQSWVEVVAADGRRLEYGMLAPDTTHEYRSDTILNVRLGNAQGAQLSADGQSIDLSAFQRGNVAHLRLFGGGTTIAERPLQ